ncbi:aldehyde-activating protein [Sphingobium lactosutens]|uniref:GFA family protein n=1 Tax=Sphingobium lactosutens TaxID=522773 RepID=UPI0015C027D5|nr:GFA family protein [Sphingobium lactosutens]NWK97248.1 aldehyde-activating protein [Sphingobium lactosutens]
MTEPVREAGQCLCGAVRFDAVIARAEMGACHCAMCRRWTGGVFLSVECQEVVLADPDAMGVYASSEWGERGFCKTCGSSLLWRSKDGAQVAVSVQAFADPGAFPFTTQIFIEEKPASYNFREETEVMTGAEVFAAFAPGNDI